MEIRLTNWDTKTGYPELIIRKAAQPEKYVVVIVGDNRVLVDKLELKTAVEAII